MDKINLSELSNTFQAYLNCIESKNTEWEEKHKERIEKMLEALPSGSGIDSGMKFLWEESKPEKLMFSFGWHHMDEHGGYDGWTDHRLICTPSFMGIDMTISGRNRNQIKDYLYDLFHETFYVNPKYQIKP